jgi:catechol 2,3-dioxygenase-like lactoylglutathione lyase family enzyme
MIKSIRHTGLVVANMERAIHFWCDILGFSIIKKMDEYGPHMDAILGLKDVYVTTTKISSPDSHVIELLYFHSHPDKNFWKGKVNSTGFTHIALTVEDLDMTCKKLLKEGVVFNAPPQFSPDGYAKVTYGQGPEGVLLELVEVLGNE